MGYTDLLQVLGEEAAREARDVRAAAQAEAERIVAEARAEAAAACEALVTRTRAECAARQKAALESLTLERDRELLVERTRLLEALREDVKGRLPSLGGAALDARLLAEVLPEAGDGPLDVVVDPGAEASAQAALAALSPQAAERATVRASSARRGGIAVVAGRRVLDDTLPSRLERAWPDLEAELAAILGEG